jgi:uncharacterized integral membrane protein
MRTDPHTSMLRASDAERERTVAFLTDQCAEGRLTRDELAARVEAAYRAVRVVELERLTADLPRPAPPVVPRQPRSSWPVAPLAILTLLLLVLALHSVPALVWILVVALALPMLVFGAFVAGPLLVAGLVVHRLLSRRRPAVGPGPSPWWLEPPRRGR